MWVQVQADKKRKGVSRHEKAEKRQVVANRTDASVLHSKCSENKAEEDNDCYPCLIRLVMLRSQTES